MRFRLRDARRKGKVPGKRIGRERRRGKERGKRGIER